MIRRVAFKKALLAGALGALAWEISARLLIWLGVPLFDLVRSLGTIAFGGDAVFWQWWPAGMSMHVMIGAIWAVFYAYFFWSMFDCPPAVQGIIFSVVPAVLAGMIMLPQMDYMRSEILAGQMAGNGFFASQVGLGGPVAVILGHLIYGAVMGTIYQKPVGYPVGRKGVPYG